MRFHRAIAPLAVLFSWLGVASAQIVTFEKIGNETITCTRSGLSSGVNDCGVHSWDTYVFVGSISVHS
jgi:hypothetical protein